MSGKAAFASEKVLVNSDEIVSLAKESYFPGGTVPQTISAIITFEDVTMRFMVTGENPTRDTGHIMSDGDVLTLESINEIRNFKALRTNKKDGFFQVTYIR